MKDADWRGWHPITGQVRELACSSGSRGADCGICAGQCKVFLSAKLPLLLTSSRGLHQYVDFHNTYFFPSLFRTIL